MSIPQSNRIKLDQPQLRSESDVNQALLRYSKLDNKLKLWKARLKMFTEMITNFVQGKVNAIATEKTVVKLQIEQYLRHNAKDFEKPRSKVLTFGKIGWRKSNGKFTFTDDEERLLIERCEGLDSAAVRSVIKVKILGNYEDLHDVIQTLRDTKRGNCVEESLLKDAIHKLPDGDFALLNLERPGTDAPFLETNREAIVELPSASLKQDAPDQDASEMEVMSKMFTELKEVL